MKCPIQCRFTYYTLEVSQDKRQETLEVENHTWASIQLKHRQLPDYIVKHVTEDTFITFICNFGGIISLWLGFSIMSVTQDILAFTSKFIISKCSLNFTQNTINNNNINIKNEAPEPRTGRKGRARLRTSDRWRTAVALHTIQRPDRS